MKESGRHIRSGSVMARLSCMVTTMFDDARYWSQITAYHGCKVCGKEKEWHALTLFTYSQANG